MIDEYTKTVIEVKVDQSEEKKKKRREKRGLSLPIRVFQYRSTVVRVVVISHRVYSHKI